MQIHCRKRMAAWRYLIVAGALGPGSVVADEDASPWHYQTYIDAGYAGSNRSPSDDAWRSKGTTAVLNQPELFLAMANVGKEATA